jgi:hypothetical protein
MEGKFCLINNLGKYSNELKNLRSNTLEMANLEIEKVNNLINGILKEFTIENLLSYLIKLGQNVEIMVTNQQEDKSQPKINVVYQKIA